MLFNLYFKIFNIKKYIEALCMSNILKKKKHYHGKLRVKWLLHECVWYCGSCCGCDLKKIIFIKSTFS